MGLIEFQGYAPKHLSYSTIGTYRMCGAKFRFEKVMRLEQRPGVAAIGGNAVHVASEAIDHLIWEQGFEALNSPDAPAVDSLNPSDPQPNF